VDRDAWRAVQHANQFNEKPVRGITLVMTMLEYQCLGSGRENLSPLLVFKKAAAMAQRVHPVPGFVGRPAERHG